jgi:hypothetical protein
MKKYLLSFLIIFIVSQPALADYNYDGIPLRTVKHGTVNGGLYIGGGHGMVYTTSYIQNFTVPNGTMQWARLYVSAKDTTWMNVSLNGHVLGNYTDLASNPKVYTNYLQDHNMYWAYYDDVADYMVNGINTATAYLGSRVGFNTKSWGIILLAAYEGGDNPEYIEYWVNEGNHLLHGDHLPFTEYHNTTRTSFADIHAVDNVTNATLWTAYIWGSEESEPHDSIWFNSDLIAEDASDGAGTDDQGNIWRGACFDLEKWDVTPSLAQNNVLLFDRGGDGLLCPVGAILMVKRGLELTTSSQTVNLSAHILPAASLEITPAALDFGTLASGWQSGMQMLTLSNTGTCNITVTPDVTDTAVNLYVDGLLLDARIWNTYVTSIERGGAVKSSAVIDVPVDYTGVGIKEGTIIFWAQTE